MRLITLDCSSILVHLDKKLNKDILWIDLLPQDVPKYLGISSHGDFLHIEFQYSIKYEEESILKVPVSWKSCNVSEIRKVSISHCMEICFSENDEKILWIRIKMESFYNDVNSMIEFIDSCSQVANLESVKLNRKIIHLMLKKHHLDLFMPGQ